MRRNRLYRIFLEYLNNISGKSYTESSVENLKHTNNINELIDLHENLQKIAVPEPSDAMKETFEEHLEKLTEQKVKRDNNLIYGYKKDVLLKIAAAIIIFISGFSAGTIINNQSKESHKILTELQNTQKILMLTLLDQPAVTDRLKAVNISYGMVSNDSKIIDALFTTLNNDPNINVRLSAIDALISKADNPNVRIGLIQSINNQESPLIQSTLADAMVYLNEARSIEHLQKLLDSDKLDSMVKKKLEKSIQILTKI